MVVGESSIEEKEFEERKKEREITNAYECHLPFRAYKVYFVIYRYYRSIGNL